MLPGTGGMQQSWANGAGHGGDRGSGALEVLQPWEGSPGGGGSLHPQGRQDSMGHGCGHPSLALGDSPALMGTRDPRGPLPMNAAVGSMKTRTKSHPSSQHPGKRWDFYLTFAPWSIQERLTGSGDVVPVHRTVVGETGSCTAPL